MSWFSSIRNFFRDASRRRHDYDPSTVRFQQLDTKRIAEKLNLISLGESRGKQNLPRSNDTSFDDVEQKIVSLIVDEQTQARDRAVREFTIYDNRIGSFSFMARFSEVTRKANDATAKFQQLRTIGLGEIRECERQVTASQIELDDFKTRHKLNRIANYPASRLLLWGILALIIIVESGINGVLLSASTDGLIEGIVYALAISVVNVGLGLVVGRISLPMFHHKNWIIKLLGIVPLVIAACGIAAVNLFAAHFRDLSQGVDALNAQTALIRRIVTDPFEIAQLNSWMLLGLGLIFALIAVVDGFKMDDPYPNYGKLDRRLKLAQLDFVDAHASIVDHAEDIHSSTAAELSAVAEGATNAIALYRSMIQGREGLLLSLKMHMQHIEQVGRELLAIYRHANMRMRAEAPPEHFSKLFNLDENLEELSKPITGQLTASAVERKINQAVSELTSIRDNVLREYEVTLNTFRNLPGLIGTVPANA